MSSDESGASDENMASPDFRDRIVIVPRRVKTGFEP